MTEVIKNDPEGSNPIVPEGTNENDQKNADLYAEVRKLRAENKEKRLLLVKFETEQKAKDEAELSYKDKHDKLKVEFDGYKGQIARTKLEEAFMKDVIKAGLPEKIARVAIPKDLDEDSMKDAVKEAVKEFKDFIKVADKVEEKAPINPMASVQPGVSPGKSFEEMSPQELLKYSIEKDKNKNKI